jgi:uncharacterized protein YcaQ
VFRATVVPLRGQRSGGWWGADSSTTTTRLLLLFSYSTTLSIRANNHQLMMHTQVAPKAMQIVHQEGTGKLAITLYAAFVL